MSSSNAKPGGARAIGSSSSRHSSRATSPNACTGGQLARFFLQAFVSDRFGKNTRSTGARKELLELDAMPVEKRSVRVFATVIYFVYPNTILVVHPDWVSFITMVPETASESTYSHAMLVPANRLSDDDRAHWTKTWGLIEGKVFQTEDLFVAESIQSGLSADLEREFRISSGEMPIRWFHDALEEDCRG